MGVILFFYFFLFLCPISYGYYTWEWKEGIRSYVYPMLIAGIYKILAIFGLDSVNAVIYAPRIVQALVSAYCDYRFYLWTGRRKWGLFLTTVNWFWVFMCTRTLINTVENNLTSIALSYFPWHFNDLNYLPWALLCCYIRPTAILVWFPLIIYHFYRLRSGYRKLLFLEILKVGQVSIFAR